ncbi:uncharacterized protein [Phaseolus vulgaris]|uniref:uncharacterized protein n=1 Tax=Phaseolus vulgaris TaxID=3885 RepID=UPI0035CA5B2E
MWGEINGFRSNQLSKAWCVIGDFNSVRRQEERKSMISVTDYSREIKGFNEFIEKSELVDIPLNDRVLVSKEWLEAWPLCQQFVLNRSISDHCAVVLKEVSVDWGSRPFRSLDVWQKDSRFKDFVRLKWDNFDVQGSGIYVLKEKLKKLKIELKIWNKEVFGDVNLASEELQMRIDELDTRDDDNGLEESEREERRSRNELHGLFVEGRWCEDKGVIKDKVRDFFKDRFDRNDVCQVRLDNVRFNSISEAEMLVGSSLKKKLGLRFGIVKALRALVLMDLILVS